MPKDADNIVKINDIHDLKLERIKPSDLGKIYVDKTGQEYKLRYDEIKKKVVIVKIIKSVLDGKYIKNKFDKNIATDKKVEVEFKHKMGELSSQFVKDKYNLDTDAFKDRNVPEPDDNQASSLKKTNGITNNLSDTSVNKENILTLEDAFKKMEIIKQRLTDALKNIYESNVYNERYNYDDKIFLEDLSGLIKQCIVGELNDVNNKYEDIMKGYEDTNLTGKLYSDQIKAKVHTMAQEDKLTYLRQLRGAEIFVHSLDEILKTFNDLDYKLSTIPEEKINARIYNERQKFSDAKLSINTCNKDAKELSDFFKLTLQKLNE